MSCKPVVSITRVVRTLNSKREVDNAFRKYMRGDWGISKDKRMNNQAVKNGDDRIMGVYPTSEGDIWIITEWDRSVTTMLFPSEY